MFLLTTQLTIIDSRPSPRYPSLYTSQYLASGGPSNRGATTRPGSRDWGRCASLVHAITVAACHWPALEQSWLSQDLWLNCHLRRKCWIKYLLHEIYTKKSLACIIINPIITSCCILQCMFRVVRRSWSIICCSNGIVVVALVTPTPTALPCCCYPGQEDSLSVTYCWESWGTGARLGNCTACSQKPWVLHCCCECSIDAVSACIGAVRAAKLEWGQHRCSECRTRCSECSPTLCLCVLQRWVDGSISCNNACAVRVVRAIMSVQYV